MIIPVLTPLSLSLFLNLLPVLSAHPAHPQPLFYAAVHSLIFSLRTILTSLSVHVSFISSFYPLLLCSQHILPKDRDECRSQVTETSHMCVSRERRRNDEKHPPELC